MDYEDLEQRTTQILPLSQQTLADMSIVELEERVVELKAEIDRCEAMIESKKGSLAGAEAYFRK